MYFLERPSEGEVERLEETYGPAKRRVVTWDRRTVDYRREMEEPLCFGEVVLLIVDHDGRLAVVRKRGSPMEDWGIPTGIIEEGETVDAACLREGLEETGRTIRIDTLRGIHKVRVHFKEWDVERWFFILRCTALAATGDPRDSAEIEEVRFIRLPEETPSAWAGSEWHRNILADGGLLEMRGALED